MTGVKKKSSFDSAPAGDAQLGGGGAGAGLRGKNP